MKYCMLSQDDVQTESKGKQNIQIGLTLAISWVQDGLTSTGPSPLLTDPTHHQGGREEFRKKW